MAKAFTDQIDQAELAVIMRELESCLKTGVNGDVVELGCYKGETSMQIYKLIQRMAPSKHLWLYDSFEGLPEKSSEDNSPAGEQFKAGELPASKKEVVRRFRQAGYTNVHIKKAWFSELTPADMPEQISFAFLDGDFYQSILDSLELIWPRMDPRGVVIIDDYQTEALPGVRRALAEWGKRYDFLTRVESSLAIISL